jgi:hypothetical protein
MQTADVLLLIGYARDRITAEMRTTKARLRQARAAH